MKNYFINVLHFTKLYDILKNGNKVAGGMCYDKKIINRKNV